MSDKQKIIDQEKEIEELKEKIERLEDEVDHLECAIREAEDNLEGGKPILQSLFDVKDNKEKFDSLISKMYWEYLGRIV